MRPATLARFGVGSAAERRAETPAATTGLEWPRGRRLLMLHQSADLYGSDRMFLEVVRWLRDTGAEPVAVLPAGGALVEALRDEGIEVHGLREAELLKLRRSQFSPAGLVRLAAAVPAALRALDTCVGGRRIDAVYSSTLATLGGALWARARGRPHLWHLHEVLERPRLAGWALAHLVSASANHVICNSAATRQWLSGHCPTVEARSSVAWNGVEALCAAEGEAPIQGKGRPAGNDDVVIGLVGRINGHKGHNLLLQALALLHDAGEHRPRLVFAGDTATGAEGCGLDLAARIAASPVAGRVETLGFVAETGALYASLDIVCVPSTCAEGFGLVAVEAMAAGKPVVAADLGGLREVVDPGVTGWLHRPGDAADLAACLARLIDDAGLRLAMGRRGRERFERHFTLDCMRHRLAVAFAGIGKSLPP